MTPMRHALPMKIIVQTSGGAKLCLVCRTVQYWLLPILYHTVVLSSSAVIERFAASITGTRPSASSAPLIELKPSALVRKLWIGPTSSIDQAYLSYNSPAWPVPRICAILALCQSLHALAIMNVHQKSWPRLALDIPRGVRALWIGLVHGKADWRYLPCAASAREFLTMDTYMTEDELRQIVRSQSIRRVRRFFSKPQLGCVEDARGLEKLEVVCCSSSKEEAATALEEALQTYRYEPTPHVALIPRSHMYKGRCDPLALLHDDWLSATRVRC
ncbi:uncharacterized protein TRAVEDRAFT_38405 [Trametes versicolor FP-101664 SS1]|uniref:uncharacterized protein n=1 Tax=Trametes versicolor (strain FP-101664) TaxID=717944 RepID=UPI0004622253|nr:uncharacterized protein TRAVEDRAFT_38405 [Trametes versicolor FP-101664 SS1]EIW56429.1 hypothetical protein TRAVEDRAFT_38405 [Trametes versicolor FP-101664 SS1]